MLRQNASCDERKACTMQFKVSKLFAELAGNLIYHVGLNAATIKCSYSDENESLVIALSAEPCVGLPVTRP